MRPISAEALDVNGARKSCYWCLFSAWCNCTGGQTTSSKLICLPENTFGPKRLAQSVDMHVCTQNIGAADAVSEAIHAMTSEHSKCIRVLIVVHRGNMRIMELMPCKDRSLGIKRIWRGDFDSNVPMSLRLSLQDRIDRENPHHWKD
jgi:hypothetical protein